ncbi:hypothetical protein BG006_008996, partial [Podila minutissima]
MEEEEQEGQKKRKRRKLDDHENGKLLLEQLGTGPRRRIDVPVSESGQDAGAASMNLTATWPQAAGITTEYESDTSMASAATRATPSSLQRKRAFASTLDTQYKTAASSTAEQAAITKKRVEIQQQQVAIRQQQGDTQQQQMGIIKDLLVQPREDMKLEG